MNAPDVSELFVLQPGVKKVSQERDTKVQNASTFTLQKEDHTMGNLIRMQLLRNPAVRFAGYKIPHPLEHYVVIKVQTTPESNPSQAVSFALRDINEELADIEHQFKEKLAPWKASSRQEVYL
eukprot:CAMPEP_0177649326 /NCGR_PEP_ID=MMETSP0447-20121125/11322_1 /TAXON_ID=0 /ORGANISM="Stygamoeba regulata, Strain BSH-02190019" /LENGTH=122 /DNA_ID=CAMNT_0019152067 /DNA_START=268 /DNA_END=636 /DNA_ORIENTATION=+